MMPQPSSPSNIIRLPLLSRDLVSNGGKVMADIMASIEGIYGVGRRWSTEELFLLHDICQEPTAWAECQRICAYHQSLSSGSKMFPHSSLRMLKGWNELLDRQFVSKKPQGPVKDPRILKAGSINAQMALLRARSFNEDTRIWLTDDRAINDRSKFNELREELKNL